MSGITEEKDAPILEARDLVKVFGKPQGLLNRNPQVQAVSGVSLSIRRGETFAIVGESGCGKSTLGRLLLRLLEPTSGEVHFEGRNISEVPSDKLRSLRRDLQIVFQDPFASLNPRMTVGQIVAEPIRLHGLAKGRAVRDKVDELLRTVGLRPDFADRYPHEFSGGQRQRIGIARALASGPKLIVGDEPVSALDVSIQAQVVNLLEELKEKLGLTLVIVAHDLAVIRHMSDRVAVMYLGQTVEVAEVDALYEAPLHPYTRALLGAIPVSSPTARRVREPLGGDVPSPTAPPPGCRFHTRCPHARTPCRETAPELETVQGDRQVACHFWREIAAEQGGALAAATPHSPALARRLELFRSRQAGP
ncbi:ABC transporter ATP-binding protein [Pelagovum pacificum]|uniref:ATP-binding cassette domain-containing protein n=1 Tax=Pelagovum pacificum TaxID=2588711 RepID=A0A5C5GEE2_9RHOB|nr:oligopeptide/dipeptide ABC transporter ATP-binding protein [Pelagovum pacificum]QQA44305.1 ATP-binding cassette domain-containing protein [Pelagovum pacificum]TNY32574.1 ATP-binding cassette domain-containing protein [Pelagovum pacificum]